MVRSEKSKILCNLIVQKNREPKQLCRHQLVYYQRVHQGKTVAIHFKAANKQKLGVGVPTQNKFGA